MYCRRHWYELYLHIYYIHSGYTKIKMKTKIPKIKKIMISQGRVKFSETAVWPSGAKEEKYLVSSSKAH